MKRSEMITIIKIALDELDNIFPEGFGQEELAHHLLTRIEDKGMLPPSREIINSGGNEDWSYITIGEVNWESEND